MQSYWLLEQVGHIVTTGLYSIKNIADSWNYGRYFMVLASWFLTLQVESLTWHTVCLYSFQAVVNPEREHQRTDTTCVHGGER
jgi:hypothetical protein